MSGPYTQTTLNGTFPLVANDAAESVTEGIESFADKADQAIEDTQNALDKLGRITLDRSSVNVGDLEDWDPAYVFIAPSGVPGYSHNANIIDFNVGSPSIQDIDFSFSDTVIPTDDTGKFVYNAPLKPSPLVATHPGSSPGLSELTIPGAPTLNVVPEPALKNLLIPEVPEITIPIFSETLPSSNDIAVPYKTFNYSESDYSSALLTQTQSKVAEILSGGLGIPDSIWNRIWDKGREREERNGIQAVTSIVEDFHSRGFSLPQGAQVAAIRRAKLATLDAKNVLSREVAIKYAELEVDNLRFAVQQGIALESVLGGWHQQKAARMLDAAKYAYQATIEIFNAHIGFYNAKLQAYTASASVYREVLQAEIVKMELYKADLEGQKLISETNKQLVDIYNARNQALLTQVELYNGQLDGVQAQVDIDKTRIAGYSEQVKAFGELIAAKGQEYTNYKTQVESEAVRAGAYDTEIKAYISRVEAYKVTRSTEALVKETQVSINELKLKQYAQDLDAYNARIQSEMVKLEAAVKQYDSQVKSYALKSDNETKRVDYRQKSLNLSIAYADQYTRANIAWAGNRSEASKAEAALFVSGYETIAKVNAQIAASAMSAVNLGASISEGVSNGTGVSTTSGV